MPGRVSVAGIPVALAVASILAAQPNPVALTLVEKGIQSLHEFQSLEFTMSVVGLNASAQPVTTNAHFYASHEKFRFDMTGNTNDVMAVADGQYLWTWEQASNQYQKAPQNLTAVRRIENLLVGLRGDEASVRDLKIIRSDTITVDGQPHECWVLEGSMPIPPSVTDGRKGSETLWYDKTLGLLLRKDAAIELPSRPAVLIGRDLVHDLKTDGPVDASRFIFRPPAGSKEQAPQARPTASAGAGDPIFRSPKSAGGPSLVIVKQVAPVYPINAKKARAEGTVRLEAIIAKDGTVESLKLISGNPLLVDAAMAAAKQWVYKPTLLNGDPVEIMTVITLDFHLDTPAHATGR